MNQHRIYAVKHRGSSTIRIVEAMNRAQALRHVAESEYDVSVPDQKTVFGFANGGIRLEHASAVPAQESA